MRTSREESSVGGVASRAERACGQTPAMEEGSGVVPGHSPGSISVLNSPNLRSLVGGECLQILRCGICMEFFNIPIVLPCGHTFCLQCLTEMCKHATSPRGPNSAVTEKDASINTERSLIGPPIRAVSEEALCGVLRDLDRLSASLEHRSVVDDAFFEIENIRRLHLADLDKASGHSTPDVNTTDSARTNGSNDATHVVQDAARSVPIPDSSTTTTRPEPTQYLGNLDLINSNPPKRCYAAALTSSGKCGPSPVPTLSVSNKNASHGQATRGEQRTSYVGSSLFPVLPCKTRTLPLHQSGLQSVQHSAPVSGFRNQNRNNSEASHDVSPQQMRPGKENAQSSTTTDLLYVTNIKQARPCWQDVLSVVRDGDWSYSRRGRTNKQIRKGKNSCMTMKQEDCPFRKPRKHEGQGELLSTSSSIQYVSPELSSVGFVQFCLDAKPKHGLGS